MPDRDVPRVLVIDDDVRVRHFLTTALGAAGFAVTATGTGEEGLRLAAARPQRTQLVLVHVLQHVDPGRAADRLSALREFGALVLVLYGLGRP